MTEYIGLKTTFTRFVQRMEADPAVGMLALGCIGLFAAATVTAAALLEGIL